MSTFSELGLKEEILSALIDMGYETPSEIQEKAVPQVISSTDDLKAFAQTGTGKTAAFSLPIIQQIDVDNSNVQAIILSPTRELAVQIGDQIEKFSKNIRGLKVVTVYGGASIEDQTRKLNKGAQIVVGTPGRTVDLINRRRLKLGNLQWLVLDEADEMLNMGFKDDLDAVLQSTPETKQTLLFSATFPREVEAIARNYMHNPVEISAGTKNTGSDDVSNEYYVVTERNRYAAIKRIADVNPDIYGIIFCRTRRECQEVSEKLIADGYSADSLHGDLSQAQRDSVMQKFRKKTVQMLVATDVAARGLDVTDLTHVINHKLPDQNEAYTHRSGRTGRAGKKGVSIVLVTNREVGKLRPIERKIQKKFIKREVPSGTEICKIQLFKLVEKVKNTEINTEAISGYLENIYSEFEGLSREELIQKFISVEFNAFLEYYSKADDINDNRAPREADDRGRRRDDENMSRFFINIGRKDSLTPPRLMGLINDQNITNNVEIGQIEILDTFSFFELDKNFEKETIEAFLSNSPEFEGRSVNVEITKKRRSGGGGGRGGDRRPRRDGGNFRGGDRGPRRDGGDFKGKRRESTGGNRDRESRSSGSSSRVQNKSWGRKRD
ncbi:DEAD/DEAH box helicase [Wenyingzhuangia aestuarii]|uniref:DEAD/DEAH box helicase n=1 Tax=Wenyingzhuangia aestuarii TaxID=1647582 RepID=UPI00143A88CC|nr:DEAD/DEAH box helicase [Wenyingzhuangia aestuarii]NJB83395.1 ATP-dependent RNA helicase DeaD [Wenyingzhuangia aestuarii]